MGASPIQASKTPINYPVVFDFIFPFLYNLGMERTIHIPGYARAIRKGYRVATAIPLKSEFTPESQPGLQRLEGLVAQGYGAAILTSHPSNGEYGREIRETFANRVLRDREIHIPIAIHQHKGIYDFLGIFHKVRLYSIITEDSLGYYKKHPSKAKKHENDLTHKGVSNLLTAFVKGGVDALSHGSTIIMAPQAARQSYLKSLTSATGLLLGRASEAGIKNIAVACVGVEIPDVTNYETAMHSFHLGRRFRFNMGETLTIEEFLERAKGKDTNTAKAISKVAFDQLTAVVPTLYLPR